MKLRVCDRFLNFDICVKTADGRHIKVEELLPGQEVARNDFCEDDDNNAFGGSGNDDADTNPPSGPKPGGDQRIEPPVAEDEETNFSSQPEAMVPKQDLIDLIESKNIPTDYKNSLLENLAQLPGSEISESELFIFEQILQQEESKYIDSHSQTFFEAGTLTEGEQASEFKSHSGVEARFQEIFASSQTSNDSSDIDEDDLQAGRSFMISEAKQGLHYNNDSENGPDLASLPSGVSSISASPIEIEFETNAQGQPVGIRNPNFEGSIAQGLLQAKANGSGVELAPGVSPYEISDDVLAGFLAGNVSGFSGWPAAKQNLYIQELQRASGDDNVAAINSAMNGFGVGRSSGGGMFGLGGGRSSGRFDDPLNFFRPSGTASEQRRAKKAFEKFIQENYEGRDASNLEDLWNIAYNSNGTPANEISAQLATLNEENDTGRIEAGRINYNDTVHQGYETQNQNRREVVDDALSDVDSILLTDSGALQAAKAEELAGITEELEQIQRDIESDSDLKDAQKLADQRMNLLTKKDLILRDLASDENFFKDLVDSLNRDDIELSPELAELKERAQEMEDARIEHYQTNRDAWLADIQAIALPEDVTLTDDQQDAFDAYLERLEAGKDWNSANLTNVDLPTEYDALIREIIQKENEAEQEYFQKKQDYIADASEIEGSEKLFSEENFQNFNNFDQIAAFHRVQNRLNENASEMVAATEGLSEEQIDLLSEYAFYKNKSNELENDIKDLNKTTNLDDAIENFRNEAQDYQNWRGDVANAFESGDHNAMDRLLGPDHNVNKRDLTEEGRGKFKQLSTDRRTEREGKIDHAYNLVDKTVQKPLSLAGSVMGNMNTFQDNWGDLRTNKFRGKILDEMREGFKKVADKSAARREKLNLGLGEFIDLVKKAKTEGGEKSAAKQLANRVRVTAEENEKARKGRLSSFSDSFYESKKKKEDAKKAEASADMEELRRTRQHFSNRRVIRP